MYQPPDSRWRCSGSTGCRCTTGPDGPSGARSPGTRPSSRRGAVPRPGCVPNASSREPCRRTSPVPTLAPGSDRAGLGQSPGAVECLFLRDVAERGSEPAQAAHRARVVQAPAEGTRMHALVMLSFMLGLRPGEIRALKWEAIDFDTGLVDVVSYARKTGDTGRMKTGLSPRSLKAPRRLLAALQIHRVNYNGHARLHRRGRAAAQQGRPAVAGRPGLQGGRAACLRPVHHAPHVRVDR